MDCIENEKKDKANNQLALVQEIAGLYSLKLSILNSVFRLTAYFAVFIKVPVGKSRAPYSGSGGIFRVRMEKHRWQKQIQKIAFTGRLWRFLPGGIVKTIRSPPASRTALPILYFIYT